MSTPLWVSETAAAFWGAAGGPEPFPRSLHCPIAWALPLSIVSLPRLRVADIFDWLSSQTIACRIATSDRPMRACLVARRGAGLIILDGSDPEDEQRFSLAHELAHFLRHYFEPRHRASDRLGPGVLEVFDGERPPNLDERVGAVLAQAPIGLHVHLMERASGGGSVTADIDVAEWEADRLAFELLAPAEAVQRQFEGYSPDRRSELAVPLLRSVYGLPATQAAQYASILLPGPPDSIVRRWGLAP